MLNLYKCMQIMICDVGRYDFERCGADINIRNQVVSVWARRVAI